MSENNDNTEDNGIRDVPDPYFPVQIPVFSATYRESSETPKEEQSGLSSIIEPAYKASVRRRRSKKYVENGHEQLI